MRSPRAANDSLPDWVSVWSDRVILLCLFTLPLVVAPGVKDTFRLPKDVLFRGEAIVLAGIYLIGCAERLRLPGTRRNAAAGLALAIVGWTAITTLFSTNRSRSLDAFVTVIAAVVIFLATVDLARRRRRLALLWIAIIPAVINATVGMLQEFDLWNPFNLQADLPHHLRSTALIGNPNDAGGYLAAIALAALVAAVAAEGHRWLYAAAAAFLSVGLIVNQTLTGIVALLVAALAISALRSWRLVSAEALGAILLFIIATLAFSPLRERANRVRDWLHEGNYNAITTQRLTPWAAAAMMARDHPLFGVGPGCFSWQYFPYKLKVEAMYPPLRKSANRTTNFGEVHNDHLQVLAEGGLPAYALLLGAVGTVAAISIRRRKTWTDDAGRCASLLALPLACGFVVLALAQFPLELTVVCSQFLFLSALCVGWSE